MRRLIALLAAVTLLMLFCIPVSASTGVTDARLDATLNSSGSCEIRLSGNLYIEQAGEIRFPVPENATGVTLDGAGAFTRTDGGQRYVVLSDVTVGQRYFTLHYTVPKAVSYNEQGNPQMELPMLCGFSFPVTGMTFTITVPDDIGEVKPVFLSGYHDESVDVEYTANGRQITGSILSVMKDNETLSMILEVSKSTFPRSKVDPWGGGWDHILIYIFMGLTALYWLLFLRCAPHIRKRSLLPPDGATAGEMRCVLTGKGADLTMMVMSWAQLGYILIHLQENGRVTLHKRMEMGNERGAYENKIFRSLFGKKRSVDGTGYHYARLYRQVAASRGSLTELFRRRTGNPKVLRYLAAAAGVFGGVSLAIGLAGDSIIALLIILIMGVAGGFASWLMQGWTDGLHLRNRGALILALLISGLWIVLGFIGKDSAIAIAVVAFQLFVGLAGAYGGRRTPFGRAATAQTLGLRASLRKLPPQELERIRQYEPDYFFTMAPYALAMGVDHSFAKQFGKQRLNPCPWLTTGMDGHMTAEEWSREMRRAAASLDEHQKRLPWERLTGKTF